MIRKIAPFVLATTCALVANAQAQIDACHGCNLFLVTHDADTFYLGHTVVHGVAISMTPGLGSSSGSCVGTHPNCTASPCMFGKVKIRFDNTGAGGTIVVYNPPGAGDGVEMEEGDGATLAAVSEGGPEDPQEIACGAQPLTTMILKHPNGTNYAVSLLCTNCPSQDPY